MKAIVGIERMEITDTTQRLVQRHIDMLEIDVPEDGSEFLHAIWLMVDGMEVMRFPISAAPGLSHITKDNT